MSVSFQFQQDRSNNPILKQEVLEVVASVSRLSRGNDETGGAFWRAASAGRTGLGLTGLFHRGASALVTTSGASLAATNVVFYVSQSVRLAKGRGFRAYPIFAFMLGGRAYDVITGSVDRGFASDRKALFVQSRAILGAVQTGCTVLSNVTHRHAPTTAADAVPAPIAAVQLPASMGVSAAVFNKASVGSTEEPIYNNQDEVIYQNTQAEVIYQNV